MSKILEDYFLEAATRPFPETIQESLKEIYDDLDFIINCEGWRFHLVKPTKDALNKIREEIGVLIE